MGERVVHLDSRRGAAHGTTHDGPEPVVRLAGEIVVQFAHRPAEDAAAEIAAHLTRFWDPRMRGRLVTAVTQGAPVDPVIGRVVQILAPAFPTP